MGETGERPVIGSIMGGDSDKGVMWEAMYILLLLGIPFEFRVLSAHRTPDLTAAYAKGAEARGLKAIIAGAGGAAHLPGVVAAYTNLPVYGVPMPTSLAGGLDSLLSMVQMPSGVPVATFGTGKGGAMNAALFAARVLAVGNSALNAQYQGYMAGLAEGVVEKQIRLDVYVAKMISGKIVEKSEGGAL